MKQVFIKLFINLIILIPLSRIRFSSKYAAILYNLIFLTSEILSHIPINWKPIMIKNPNLLNVWVLFINY